MIFAKKRKTNGMHRITNKLFQSNFVTRKKSDELYIYLYVESIFAILRTDEQNNDVHHSSRCIWPLILFLQYILIHTLTHTHTPRLCDVVMICTQPHRYIKPMHQLLEKSLSSICECISDALSFLASHIVCCYRQSNEIFQLSMIFWPRKKNFVPTCTN